ncbi:MAG: TonB-dependent receptor, partial [Opitutus sp.]
AKFSQANIFGDSSTALISRIIAYDARVSGRLFTLPTGAVEAAGGAAYRKETLKATADMNSVINPVTGTSAWNNGVTLNPFDAGRTIQALFLELKVPLTSPEQHLPGLYTVVLDGAVRREYYSDTDDPTVPKVSLRWLPFDDQFAFRATYSKSFSAPTLYSLFGPSNSGATPSLAGLTAYNTAGQPIGPFPPVQGNQQSGSNPNLRPSHSKNYTLGFVYSPKAVKGLSVSVDYYTIKETDIVGALATPTTIVQDVEQYGPASHLVNYVHLGNFGQLGGTVVTTPGQLSPNPGNIYVDQFNANVASQQQDGVDLTFKYSWRTNHGTFDFSSSWAYLRSFRIQSAPGEDYTEYSGTNGYGTLPRYREYSTVAWQSGAWAASVSNSYVPSVTSAGSGEKVDSYTTFDLQGSVDFGKIWPKAH